MKITQNAFAILEFMKGFMKLLMEKGSKSSRHSISSQLEGNWISEYDDQQINCKVDDDKMECTWPNKHVETFKIDSDQLKGLENPAIYGYPTKDGLITWSSGNKWIKDGN